MKIDDEDDQHRFEPVLCDVCGEEITPEDSYISVKKNLHIEQKLTGLGFVPGLTHIRTHETVQVHLSHILMDIPEREE